MARIVLALDQGTSSSRSILFDEAGAVLAMDSAPLACAYPHAGWVEQDPHEIWGTQRRTIEGVLAKAGIGAGDIAAIGITNQRETTLAWHRESGEPLGPAIVWQCRRTAAICDGLKAEGFEAEVRARTGLVIDPYFSGTKMQWILREIPGAKELATAGKLAFGTVDSWLIWNLTGGAVHATDASNASRTMVYNIFEGDWDQTILDKLEIPRETLPDVRDSSGVAAHTAKHVLGAEIPIAGIAGDQQAALFGQACFAPGAVKNTYGTGCFMLINTGGEAVRSDHGLLTTIAWRMGGEVTYALEGAVFVAGALMQWLRDGLGLMADAAESEGMALAVPDTGGVYIVPAFVGLGAPHWDPYARGTILGLTRDSSRNHLVRAGLEAIAYQSWEVLECMLRDTGLQVPILRVDGGAASNDFLCQFQADTMGIEVSRPRIVETTAMGAAFLAGLAVGVWPHQTAIGSLWSEQRRFTPQRSRAEMQPLLDGWRKAVQRSKGWAAQ
ncbi:MAG: glycerol kinase GlpK [SAR324 cluster bacterium]|nr:glycerol kinase GlpK [SAR324 cluster bacterium]